MTELEQLQEEIAVLDLEYQLLIQPHYERRKELLQRVARIMRLPVLEPGAEPGHHWQAPDGTVFEIVERLGKFVFFERWNWIRTRRGYLGEKNGPQPLAKKRAEQVLGYDLGDNYVLKVE